MSDCFKSFSTGAEILIFAAQEHHQDPRSEPVIIINESHFLARAGCWRRLRPSEGEARRASLSIWSHGTRNETICYDSLIPGGAHLAHLFTSVGVLRMTNSWTRGNPRQRRRCCTFIGPDWSFWLITPSGKGIVWNSQSLGEKKKKTVLEKTWGPWRWKQEKS